MGAEHRFSGATPKQRWRQRALFLALAVGLLVGFLKPILELVRFASHSELYSHILLIPFVSAYLVWWRRPRGSEVPASARRWTWLPLLAGLSALGAYAVGRRLGWQPAIEDYLALMTFALLCFLLANGFAFLDAGLLRQMVFPIGFLFFAIPFPRFVEDWIMAVLQHGSTYVTHALLTVSGMSFTRHGLSFEVPGLTLHVAPQCSGIHSTLVLFITSVFAGYLFLQSPGKRAVLTLAVLPLALLRNGLRIFTVAQLCVQIGPDMIDSAIHRKGGPVFFVLSLIPLIALLFWLRKAETGPRRSRAVPDLKHHEEPI